MVYVILIKEYNTVNVPCSMTRGPELPRATTSEEGYGGDIGCPVYKRNEGIENKSVACLILEVYKSRLKSTAVNPGIFVEYVSQGILSCRARNEVR